MMEIIIKGTYEDTRSSDEYVVRERVFVIIVCCGLFWGFIVIWFVFFIIVVIGYLIRRCFVKDDFEVVEVEN